MIGSLDYVLKWHLPVNAQFVETIVGVPAPAFGFTIYSFIATKVAVRTINRRGSGPYAMERHHGLVLRQHRILAMARTGSSWNDLT